MLDSGQIESASYRALLALRHRTACAEWPGG
jgi:hypothetical protein